MRTKPKQQTVPAMRAKLRPTIHQPRPAAKRATAAATTTATAADPESMRPAVFTERSKPRPMPVAVPGVLPKPVPTEPTDPVPTKLFRTTVPAMHPTVCPPKLPCHQR